MKTRLVLLTTIFLTGILISTSGLAQADCKNKHDNNMKKSCFINDLTPEQQQKIETIKLNSEKKTILYKADLKIKKAELDKLMLSESPSKKDIDLKVDEISVIKANLQKENLGRKLLIREELTPEQRVVFDAHHANKSHENKMKSDYHGNKMNNESNHGQMNHEGCKGHNNQQNK